MSRFRATSAIRRLMGFFSQKQPEENSLDRNPVHRTMDEMIREAITEKRLLAFDYDGYHRIIESHIYARKHDKNGILAYQIDGKSSSGELGWKRMHMKKITNMRVLDETFSGIRPVTNWHSAWDLFYLIVDE